MRVIVILFVITACQALCRRDGYFDGYTDKRDHCMCMDDKGTVDDFIHRRVRGIPRIGTEPVAPFKKEYEPRGNLFVDSLKDEYDL